MGGLCYYYYFVGNIEVAITAAAEVLWISYSEPIKTFPHIAAYWTDKQNHVLSF